MTIYLLAYEYGESGEGQPYRGTDDDIETAVREMTGLPEADTSGDERAVLMWAVPNR